GARSSTRPTVSREQLATAVFPYSPRESVEPPPEAPRGEGHLSRLRTRAQPRRHAPADAVRPPAGGRRGGLPAMMRAAREGWSIRGAARCALPRTTGPGCPTAAT